MTIETEETKPIKKEIFLQKEVCDLIENFVLNDTGLGNLRSSKGFKKSGHQ